MRLLRYLKERITTFLIWLDGKLGGDGSTQSHAGDWEDAHGR